MSRLGFTPYRQPPLRVVGYHPMITTRFSQRNETAPAKCLVREARVKLAQLYIDTVNPSTLELYSLPARLGLFEKALKPALATLDSWRWRMFERERSIWDRISNPFGRGRVSPNVSYLHDEMHVTESPFPAIFDGDFCGYLTDQMIQLCIKPLAPDSLLMLTLGTRVRSQPWNLVYPVANLLKRNDHRPVSVEEVGDAYIETVEGCLEAKGIPFTRLLAHHYTNTGRRSDGHGSPMVCLGWHLAANSPLKNLVTLDTLGLTRPTNSIKMVPVSSRTTPTMVSTRNNIRTAIRANVVKLLVANKGKLGITNVQIDRLLRVPAYTAAGYDASAKRYGPQVLQLA